MKKVILGVCVFIFLSGAVVMVQFYNNNQQKRLDEKLVKLLVVHTAFDKNGEINLYRHGKDHDGGYVVPKNAIEKADALLGYGIANDNSFEEKFSNQYNKPSYGFDCGIDGIKNKNKLFTFIKECIASDAFLFKNQTSSRRITSFTQHLNHLNLNKKKIFIKMDIEGAEYEAFDEILNHVSQITGIILEIHFLDRTSTDNAIKLISNLNQDFILLHVHNNNCARSYFSTDILHGHLSRVLELTYINKYLVKHYSVAKNQIYPTSLDMPNCPGYQDISFEIL